MTARSLVGGRLPSMNASARVTWLAALSSLALFVTSAALAVHVRLGLGHWPKPMWEDYRTVGFEMHQGVLIGVALFALYVAGPLWAVFVCIPRLRQSWGTHWRQLAVYALGWCCVLAFIALDPYHIVTWWRD